MKALTCAATRRRVDGFLDGELPIADQIAVRGHEWCGDCAALRSVRLVLRAFARGRAALSSDEAAGFSMGVVGRVNAEREA